MLVKPGLCIHPVWIGLASDLEGIPVPDIDRIVALNNIFPLIGILAQSPFAGIGEGIPILCVGVGSAFRSGKGNAIWSCGGKSLWCDGDTRVLLANTTALPEI